MLKRKRSKYYPYKSGLEYKVAKVLVGYLYEDENTRVDYTVSRRYSPDFSHPKLPWLIIEVKGFFNKRANDALKYRSIKDSNPDKRIIFIWSNPHKNYGAKRVDGTAMTYAEWCIKYGFCFFSVDSIPKELVSGKVSKAWVDKQIKEQAKPKEVSFSTNKY